MRALHAILALLLTAPVLGATALDPPEVATTPPPSGTDDTCLAAVLPPQAPPAPAAVPCTDLPLLVDEGGDTMGGDLAFVPGAGIAFSGGLLRGASSNSLQYGSRNVCLASAAINGCPSSGTAPIAVSGSSISLSAAGCAASEAWLWSGTAWSCDDVATQAELGAVNAQLQAQVKALDIEVTGHTATLNSHTTTLNSHAANLNSHTATLSAHTASLTNHQNQLNAVNAELDSTAANLQGQVNTVSASLASHKTSTDHDDRYARDNHGHDIQAVLATNKFVNSTTPVVVASVTVTVPEDCTSSWTQSNSHRFLVQASGTIRWASTGGTVATSRILTSLTYDDTAHGTRLRTVGVDEVNAYMPVSSLGVFTMPPGTHTIRLLASKFGAGYTDAWFDYPDLMVMHLGSLCP